MIPALPSTVTSSRQAQSDARTYLVSDERLRRFATFSHAQRLQWVEQCSQFVRLAQEAKRDLDAKAVHAS